METTRATRATRQAGLGSRGLLVVLIALLAGAGAWNYRRNLVAEQQVFRPYRGYSDAELGALEQAYRRDVERLEDGYAAARGPSAAAEPQGLQERIDAFERARRSGERARALGASLGEREAALRDLEQEERLRAAERDRLGTFLRRLLTL